MNTPCTATYGGKPISRTAATFTFDPSAELVLRDAGFEGLEVDLNYVDKTRRGLRNDDGNGFRYGPMPGPGVYLIRAMDSLSPVTAGPAGPARAITGNVFTLILLSPVGVPVNVPPADAKPPIVVGTTSREVSTLMEVAMATRADQVDQRVKLKPGLHTFPTNGVTFAGKRLTIDTTGCTLVQRDPNAWGTWSIAGSDIELIGGVGDIHRLLYFAIVRNAQRVTLRGQSLVGAKRGDSNIPGGGVLVYGCKELDVIGFKADMVAMYLLMADRVDDGTLNDGISMSGLSLGIGSDKESGIRLHNYRNASIADSFVNVFNKATLRAHDGQGLAVTSTTFSGGTTNVGGPWHGTDSGDAHALTKWLLHAKMPTAEAIAAGARATGNLVDLFTPASVRDILAGTADLAALEAVVVKDANGNESFEVWRLKAGVLRRALLAIRAYALRTYSPADVAATEFERRRWLALTTKDVAWRNVTLINSTIGANAGLSGFSWDGGTASAPAGQRNMGAVWPRAPLTSDWDLDGDVTQTVLDGVVRDVAFTSEFPQLALNDDGPFRLERITRVVSGRAAS